MTTDFVKDSKKLVAIFSHRDYDVKEYQNLFALLVRNTAGSSNVAIAMFCRAYLDLPYY